MAEVINGGDVLERQRRRYAGLIAAINDEHAPVMPYEQSRRFFEFGLERHQIASQLATQAESADGSDTAERTASDEEQSTSATSVDQV